ncbi:MAG: Sensor protein lytS [Verrucomicrobia bacterium]|nr:Sensor protein lytS [Verrucomicrobiota bacterium]
MRNLVRAFFVIFAVAVSARAEEPATVEVRLKLGDDPRYARADWDDHDWEIIPPNGFPERAGPYWVRFHLRRPAQPAKRVEDFTTGWALAPRPRYNYYNYEWPSDEPGAPIDAVVLNPIFSFEFYWDGRLLERGGVVGRDRASEIPGPVDHMFRVPPELMGPGDHAVAIRLSSHHYNFPWKPVLAFRLDNYDSRALSEARRPFLPLVGAGGSLLLGAACLAMARFVERRRPLVWCGTLGIVLSMFYALVAFRWLYNAPYSWHRPRLELTIGCLVIVAGILPWVLAEHFDLPWRRRWFLLLVPLLAMGFFGFMSHENRAFWLTRVMLLAAGAIAVWAIRRKKSGGWAVLIGAVLGLLVVGNDGRALGNSTLFVVVSGLVIFVLATMGGQMRAEQRRAREAAVAAARLEIELLKKNIQPHFLMNTLTTIMEVIEQEPKTAVALIDALAGEFRILARVSGEKLIPLEQEIDLCRAHLRIMGMRRGVECSLEAREVDMTSPIPPALFHTLVEGGLTHQIPRAGRLKFVLEGAYRPGHARYGLTVHGDNPPANGAIREGTGLRYVKARLEESFAGRWKLVAGPVRDGWQTVIEINQPPGESGSS